MRLFIIFIALNLGFAAPICIAEESPYHNKIAQLQLLNNDLRKKLQSATDEINKLKEENYSLKNKTPDEIEFEKAKKELANKSYEIKLLREKMMIAQDEEFAEKNP
jgi:regulator of replication initiation timing